MLLDQDVRQTERADPQIHLRYSAERDRCGSWLENKELLLDSSSLIGWAGLVLSVVLAIVTVQAFRFNRREREAALCLELWGLYRNRSWQEVRADLAVGEPRLDEDQWRKDFDDMVSFPNVLGRMADAGVLRRVTISSMFYSLPSLWDEAETAIAICRAKTPTYGVDFERLQASLR